MLSRVITTLVASIIPTGGVSGFDALRILSGSIRQSEKLLLQFRRDINLIGDVGTTWRCSTLRCSNCATLCRTTWADENALRGWLASSTCLAGVVINRLLSILIL